MIRFFKRTPSAGRLLWRILQPRARGLVGEIRVDLKPGSRLLDVGVGTGNIAEILRGGGFEVIPLDVQDQSLAEGLEPILYDGLAMPFADQSFDAALLITVLHHAENPDRVVAEAARVARRLIIIEDVVRGPVHRWATCALDSLLNLEFRGHPHNNRGDDAWQALFRELGLRLVARRTRWSFLLMWQVTYCLESGPASAGSVDDG